MTSSFAGTQKPPGGAAWTLANVGALWSTPALVEAQLCG